MPAKRQVGGLALSDVNGVRVLSAACDGPLVARLTFRVGVIDETLPTRGITHLVEHLALTRAENGPHAFNGETAPQFTSFVVAGEPDYVVAHLNQLCRSLCELPVDRLEHERGVIRAEAARRGSSVGHSLRVWRWGATPLGLPGYEEMGIETLTAAAAQDWSSNRFTAQNAVLWLSQALPRGLELTLPQGEAFPGLAEDPHHAIPALPTAYGFSQRMVAFSYLAPRSPSGLALSRILRGRLNQRLREELGLSYGVDSAVEPLDNDSALHTFSADCLPENAVRVQFEVSQILEAARLTAPDDAEIEAATRAKADEGAAQLSHLDRVARALLTGRTPTTRRAVEKERRDVTADSVFAALSEAVPTLLLAVPKPAAIHPRLASVDLGWSKNRVAGTRYPPSAFIRDPMLTDLYVGQNGISLVVGGAHAITVRFDACRAMSRFSNGARTLIGVDGNVVRFSPDDWTAASGVAQLLDLGVDRSVWIDGGTLTATGQPGTAKAAKVAAARQRNLRRKTAQRGTPVVLTLLIVAGIIVSAATNDSSPSTPASPADQLTQLTQLDRFMSGECLSSVDQLQGFEATPVDCTLPHAAEIIDVEPPNDTASCPEVAADELPADVVTSIDVGSTIDIFGNTVCYATGRDSAQLAKPLKRN